MHLFQHGKFKAASGQYLPWKIECDALTPEDWRCIAKVSAPRLPEFGEVYGVPQGGLKLAQEFKRYRTKGRSLVLVVDDVWTTGKSMRAFVERKGLITNNWIGFVAFERGGATPIWIYSFSTINS